MAQNKAYQPLTKFMEDTRDDYIEFERGFDRWLSDTILKDTRETCNDLLNTEDGSLFKFGNLTEKSILDEVKKAGQKLTNGIDSLLGGDFFDVSNSAINEFSQFLCVTVNGTLKTTFELLEVALSVPILLIEKLLLLLDKAINALNELTLIVMNCLIDKVNQVKNFITNLIPRAGDISSLSIAIDSCPQLYCFIVDYFKPICKDTTFNNTQELLECIRSRLTVPIEEFFNDYIINILRDLVNEFLTLVEKRRSFLVKKIRGLIKQYIKALYTKYDIPSSIRWLFTNAGTCKGPKKASIVDTIYALKSFSTCIDSVCGAINSTLKRDIQEMNQQLHFSFSFWKRFGLGYDMFLLIEREEMRYAISLDARKESIGNRNSPSDNSLTLKSTVQASSQDMNFSLKPSTDVSSIITNQHQSETQDLINADFILPNGTRLFRDGIENELVKIYQNLSQEIYVYEDKYREFSEWDNEYYKTKLNDEKKKIINNLKIIESPSVINPQSQFLSTDPVKYVAYNRVESPVFSSKKNDYKPLNIGPVPVKAEDQSDIEYYANWYKTVVG